ncbi:MAG: hypothetical protein ABIJ05_04115 [Patescibacteria group bacterium]
MDDQNNTNSTNQNPTNPLDQTLNDQNSQPQQAVPPTDLPPVPETPTQESQNMEVPSFPQMDSSTTTPPIPSVEEITEEKKGTSAPNMDIPPVIPNDSNPKKKFGGKTIATILGILVLVGAIGAGVILINQQQDIREKAAGCTNCSIYEKCVDGKCVIREEEYDKYTCNKWTGNCYKSSSGKTYTQCEAGCVKESSSSDSNTSTSKCPAGETPSTSASCPAGTKATGNTYTEPAAGGTITYPCCIGLEKDCPTGERCSLPKALCNTGEVVTNNKCESLGLGGTLYGQCCKAGTGGTGGIVCKDYENYVDENGDKKATDYPSETVAKACCPSQYYTKYDKWYCGVEGSTPINPPSSASIACLNIKAYDTSWNLLTTDQLKDLKAEDKVRFTVAGNATSGTFSKAKFTINSVAQAETTSKKPSSEEFYTEYTIPSGTTNFTINAQIHHTTKGWI